MFNTQKTVPINPGKNNSLKLWKHSPTENPCGDNIQYGIRDGIQRLILQAILRLPYSIILKRLIQKYEIL